MAVASHATAGQVTVGDFVSVDELVQPAQQPAVQQKQTANVVADLETILQERDACGVSGQFMLSSLAWRCTIAKRLAASLRRSVSSPT